MAYQVEVMNQRPATYLDKIPNDAKPRDLPVAQPVPLKSPINLKSAKPLGLTIPQTMLLCTDEVIK